ncbi:MAG: bifunctional adenosylcobinamide kinase/adenosylcobinamide-phosphate guanylyltransferase, partial [Corallincola sp.]|nr:bifunctional adenosylcobinamide kinase/adenosylcobinamide-phosphate guanylyltransferase [Corallincola sp.]
LTLWLGQLLLDDDECRLALEVDGLLQLVAGWPGPPLLLVSNEVGLGIVPESPLARRFRDESGRLHQRLAALADKVTLVVAGIPLCIKG